MDSHFRFDKDCLADDQGLLARNRHSDALAQVRFFGMTCLNSKDGNSEGRNPRSPDSEWKTSLALPQALQEKGIVARDPIFDKGTLPEGVIPIGVHLGLWGECLRRRKRLQGEVSVAVVEDSRCPNPLWFMSSFCFG